VISGSAIISDTSSLTPLVSGLGIGSNVFRWTVRNGICLPASDEVTITGNPVPVADAGPDKQSCNGVSLLEAITGNLVAGNWSQIAGTGSILNPTTDTTQVSGLSFGRNTFIWTAILGSCSSNDTMNIFRPANPVFLGNDTVICQDSSLVLDAGSGFASYLWSNGSTGQTLTIDSAGIYWVEVQTTLNCIYRDTIVVDTTICTSVKGGIANAGLRWNFYPNPNAGLFDMILEGSRTGKAVLRIFNSIGILVYEEEWSGAGERMESEIRLGLIPNGVYHLEMQTDGKILSNKMVLLR
jgi:hypothetical protein